jgi:hypothetical protein
MRVSENAKFNPEFEYAEKCAKSLPKKVLAGKLLHGKKSQQLHFSVIY